MGPVVHVAADAVGGEWGPYEALLVAGGITQPVASVVQRAFLRYSAIITASLAASRPETAVDAYRLAECLPSVTTADMLRFDGIDLDGPLSEGSLLTRCFRSRAEFLLKPLDQREFERADELLKALNGSAIPCLTSFELRSSSSKHFMLMPRFGASLEQLPHLVADDIAVLWQCMRDALRGLHALGFAYMDVKPSNICLNNRAFVLIDLGSVAQFGKGASTTQPYVPRDYPGSMCVSSARADWWLFAMTVAEKATGLEVGRGHRASMAELSARLSENLPRAVWAELREELETDIRSAGGGGGGGGGDGGK